MPILPDGITTQLGAIGLALAVDVNGIDALSFLGAQSPPCARFLVSSVRDTVATLGDGGWQALVDGLPEPAVRSCLTQLGITPRVGSNASLELDAPFVGAIDVRWRGDVATITPVGVVPRAGEAPPIFFDVVSKVPRDAKAWIGITGLPDYKIDEAVGWLQINASTWTITVDAIGMAPRAAKPWLDSLVRSFTVQLAGRGVVVEGSWFNVTEAPPAARLVATIPTDQLR